MKFYNEKIEKFVNWTISNEWPIPTMRLWKMYCLENVDVKSLDDNEKQWLQLYCESLLQKMGLVGNCKYDAVKSSLQNDFGWSEKQKIENTYEFIPTQIITTGLLTENTSAKNHINENFENEAIEQLHKEEKLNGK